MVTSAERAFDSSRYLESQVRCLHDRMMRNAERQVFLEFGGKPFGDYHAARVLPGYDPDCKVQILKQLMPVCDIAMVVNTRDILLPRYGRTLSGRIRGDSGLRYDQETIRLIDEARRFDLDIVKVILAVSPRNPSRQDEDVIGSFEEKLAREGVRTYKNYEILGYPKVSSIQNLDQAFGKNDVVAYPDKNFVAFSPGGGSGKFGIILSEMYYAICRGRKPAYIKFETFPIFDEAINHPLNLAFEAATADLGNTLVDLTSSNSTGRVTSYDKDVENFILLRYLLSLRYSEQDNIDLLANPTSMGVNRIMDGVINNKIITDACREEINRRVERYEREVEEKVERSSTYQRTIALKNFFESIYGSSAKIA